MSDFQSFSNYQFDQIVGLQEETIPPFSCVKIKSPADLYLESNEGIIVFGAEKPAVYGSQYSHFFTRELSCVYGQLGQIQRTFPAVAKYESADGTPTAGELWGPRSGFWGLKKNTGGFRVLKVLDVSQHLILVDRCPFLWYRGITNADIASGVDGTVSVWYGRNNSYTDTNFDMPDVANDLDLTVPASSVVECRWEEDDFDGLYFKIVQARCP